MQLISPTARNYAKALLEIESKDRLVLEEQIAGVIEVLEKNQDIRVFYESPRIPMDAKKKIMVKALEGFHPTLLKFIQLLVDRRRETLLAEIAAGVGDENDKLHGRVRAVVLYGHDLGIGKDDQDHEIVKQIKDSVLENRETFGLPEGDLQIIVTNVVKPELKGGVVIRIGDHQYDASVSTYIHKWRERVKKQHLNIASSILSQS